ncbi:SUKH-4 family immunity protein [Actinoplanes sp. CA-054009]
MGELRDAMLSVIRAPLGSLAGAGDRVPVPMADRWDLPERDRSVLRAYGLPRGPLMVPGPQEAAEPLLVPNVAGEQEARLIEAGQRLYLLGTYGADFDADSTIRVGVVAGGGAVLGVRRRPTTTADLHPQLRPYHPDLYQPAVRYFNASLAAFVEMAWRWLAAVKVIRAHDIEEDDLDEACSAFLAEIDPALADERLNSLWVEAILGG